MRYGGEVVREECGLLCLSILENTRNRSKFVILA